MVLLAQPWCHFWNRALAEKMHWSQYKQLRPTVNAGGVFQILSENESLLSYALGQAPPATELQLTAACTVYTLETEMRPLSANTQLKSWKKAMFKVGTLTIKPFLFTEPPRLLKYVSLYGRMNEWATSLHLKAQKHSQGGDVYSGTMVDLKHSPSSNQTKRVLRFMRPDVCLMKVLIFCQYELRWWLLHLGVFSLWVLPPWRDRFFGFLTWNNYQIDHPNSLLIIS